MLPVKRIATFIQSINEVFAFRLVEAILPETIYFPLDLTPSAPRARKDCLALYGTLNRDESVWPASMASRWTPRWSVLLTARG